MRVGDEILKGRYTLTRGPIARYRSSETWIAASGDGYEFLTRVWPFLGTHDFSFQRALWDRELRTLYRLSSSPRAEKALLHIRDAAVDRESSAFMMLLEGAGFESLEALLSERHRFPWLDSRSEERRQALWEASARLALGLELLHSQRVLHGSLSPSTIFCDPHLGPDSFRLGGFEWSIRLGAAPGDEPPQAWLLPEGVSTRAELALSQTADWFAFGVSLARLVIPIEDLQAIPMIHRHAELLRRIHAATHSELTESEKSLLLDLLALRPDERLDNPTDIYSRLRLVADALGGLDRNDLPEGSLVLVINPKDEQLLRQAEAGGFVPRSEAGVQQFNPIDPIHVAGLQDFVRSQLRASKVYGVPGFEFFVLVGGALTLRITPFRRATEPTGTWDYAFCAGAAEVRPASADRVLDVPEAAIGVQTVRDAYRGGRRAHLPRSWKRVLPAALPGEAVRRSLQQFLDFVRCTNQLELLFRVEKEVFRFEALSAPEERGGRDYLSISERGRHDFTSGLFSRQDGMVAFLEKERSTNKPGCELVALSGDTPGELFKYFSREDLWQLEEFLDDGTVLLSREHSGAAPRAPAQGLIRTYGFGGQLAVIRRRKDAIDRLVEHAFLLRSVLSPGSQYIDTGEIEGLPVPLPAERIDQPKQAVLRDILRTRPIYCLQGPPGTGKTELVANLLREILEEDPVAQVLVTAQAHPAVDVLRARVEKVVREDHVEPFPLSIRLGARGERATASDGSPLATALQVISRSTDLLGRQDGIRDLRGAWYESALALRTRLTQLSDESRELEGLENDFVELVKRSANITYCTTAARDLVDLAASNQWFDWAVVEEAGKVHGYDLALPLQAGHRWLLIGDHKQLPPFAFEEYATAIESLHAAVDALSGLPKEGGVVDVAWLQRWRDLALPEREAVREFSATWLRTFARLYDNCLRATGHLTRTVTESVGALAGFLNQQYRMHSSIANLVSSAFYPDEPLVSKTVDESGEPLLRVRHGVLRPAALGDAAVAWLDIPWAAENFECRERGKSDGQIQYSNPAEVEAVQSFLCELTIDSGRDRALELAVLSPYNRQNELLRDRLVDFELPPGLVPKRALVGSNRNRGAHQLVHTVDSFQGNESDIVILSLVRNNSQPSGEGLGFLDDPGRANVMLSRAQRLLVLVGSWSFFKHQLAAAVPEQRLWPWRLVLNTLEAMFESGEAVRLPGRWRGAQDA